MLYMFDSLTDLIKSFGIHADVLFIIPIPMLSCSFFLISIESA